jgi:hypothetical protein
MLLMERSNRGRKGDPGIPGVVDDVGQPCTLATTLGF